MVRDFVTKFALACIDNYGFYSTKMAVQGLGLSPATISRYTPSNPVGMAYDQQQRVFLETAEHNWSAKEHGVTSRKYLEIILKTTNRRFEFGAELGRTRYRLKVQESGGRYVSRNTCAMSKSR